MNVYQLYGKIGPWATPAPAALALAGRLYGEWASINQLTAWGIAVFSLVALEVVGGLCSYQAIRTSLSRQWGWFAICLLGVFAYVGLGVYALWGLTAWIYVVLAVFVHVAVAAELTAGQARSEVLEDRAFTLQEREAKLKEREAELRAAKEITAQVRAEARKAKAGQIVYPSSFGANGARLPEQNSVQPEQGFGKAVFDILNGGEQLGPRAMSRRLGCSVSTAKTHIDRWKAGSAAKSPGGIGKA